MGISQKRLAFRQVPINGRVIPAGLQRRQHKKIFISGKVENYLLKSLFWLEKKISTAMFQIRGTLFPTGHAQSKKPMGRVHAGIPGSRKINGSSANARTSSAGKQNP